MDNVKIEEAHFCIYFEENIGDILIIDFCRRYTLGNNANIR